MVFLLHKIFQIKPKPGIRIINLVVSSRGYITEIRHAPYGSSHAIELKKTDEDNRKKISGIVKNRGGEPIPGVNIIIKGSTIGTITDLSGKFLLKYNSEHKHIVVSKVGYEIETIDGEPVTRIHKGKYQHPSGIILTSDEFDDP